MVPMQEVTIVVLKFAHQQNRLHGFSAVQDIPNGGCSQQAVWNSTINKSTSTLCIRCSAQFPLAEHPQNR